MTGLMIGRTPEYLGKTVGPREVKLVGLYIVIGPVVILALTALAVVTSAGTAALSTNHGAHGFTTILFAYASCFANNGQTFGGLSADAPFYHVTTLIAMLAGRFGLAIPALALAGRFANQGRRWLDVCHGAGRRPLPDRCAELSAGTGLGLDCRASAIVVLTQSAQ